MTTAPLALLIDTNVFIAAEQHADGGHAFGAAAAELLGLAAALGFRLCVSDATAKDVTNAEGPLRARRRRALQKYHVLTPAHVSDQVRAVFPDSMRRQDENDLQVVATYAAGVAQFLISNDTRLRSRARRAGMGNVLSLAEALALLRTLRAPTFALPPAAERVDAHQVNLDAPLFDTLKEDYPFVDWWISKVVRERRDVLIVGPPACPAAVAVLKVEDSPARAGLASPTLKVCTFKVAEDAQGVRRGELLLKSVVEVARERGLTQLYLEVMPHREELVEWLPRFGFEAVSADDTNLVFVKRLSPAVAAEPREPLQHAIAYGPGSLRVRRAHVVPIQDRWHSRLLPEASDQGDLLAGSEACGNAICKAYVCRSSTRKLAPGDCLLFLRTGAGPSQVTAIGVVEDTRVTEDLGELVGAVGARTVYSRDELAAICRAGPTLAVLFRLDRRVSPPWSLTDLLNAGVLRGAPQSITELTAEGVAWLDSQLAGWP